MSFGDHKFLTLVEMTSELKDLYLEPIYRTLSANLDLSENDRICLKSFFSCDQI